jgi:hypothetical protein
MMRTILIAEIKNTSQWPGGIDSQEEQIRIQADAAFAGMAFDTVYWIGAIGPHWRYGKVEEDAPDPLPQVEWHDTIHDAQSFVDLGALADLVRAL